MPPNTKGGKGYKKGKHTSNTNVKNLDWDEDDGQMLGRVMNPLGNRRFRVYCNDNTERVCRLAGSIKPSERVLKGSLVVISLRDLGTASGGGVSDEKGDILQLVDTRLYGMLKKEEGINPALFMQLDSRDLTEIKKKVAEGTLEVEDDDLFEKSEDEEDQPNPEGEDEDVKEALGLVTKEAAELEKKKDKKKAYAEKDKKRDLERNAKRSTKGGGGGDDDLDIDAI